METNEILQADVLDILFEHRNKEYGAYQLRKTYNGRLVRAMLVTSGMIGLLFTAGLVKGHGKGRSAPTTTDVVLAAAPVDPPPPLPPPPLPPKPQVQVATIRMVTTRIVPDDQVKKEEIPPENNLADDMKIGTVNQAGDPDKGLDAGPPPVNAGSTGLVEAPKKEESTFIPIEKEAEYPGGLEAWRRFVTKNLRYPEEAQTIEIEGVVVVRFIVDKDGNVSDIEVVSGPEKGGLREEAVRVIKRSGKWTPALQNGRNVKTYRMQPIIFKMVHDE